MLRTRLFWFSLGFATTAASISHFVWRDLLAYRCALSSDASFMERSFDALEARISNLESARNRNSVSSAEGATVDKNHVNVLGSVAYVLVLCRWPMTDCWWSSLFSLAHRREAIS
ncbi:hypothetical protein Csa_016169 [Cucumis sativus]|uniref:Uncharacterized protein n=1 Tax=Cucumis sativus TaxID=3659 RepID=A0A0A0K8L3_CUCSA|nr:hypothetical protein Csa_016169 [Cucumis sativus]